ncbi:MAG: DoxX family protein [Nitrosomonas sp.]
MEKITQIIARMMLGHLFLIAGWQKIGGYEGTQGYMESVGVPGMLLPLVILLETFAKFNELSNSLQFLIFL